MKKNIFKRIIDFISERINQIDVPDGMENLTKAQEAELNNLNRVQKEVHEQRSFVPKVKTKKIDPLEKKYGPARPGNPVYEAAN